MRTARVTGRSFSPAGIVVRRGWARSTRRTMDSLAGSRRREARRGAGSADKILDRNSNFRELWRPEGEEGEAVVGVVGYGSLLSERSALSTFESVENFRLGTVRGYRRVFKHVAPIFLERGVAIRETMEMASLSVEEGCDEDAIVVSLFDMKASEVPAFISREEEYRFVAVTPRSSTAAHLRRSTSCAFALLTRTSSGTMGSHITTSGTVSTTSEGCGTCRESCRAQCICATAPLRRRRPVKSVTNRFWTLLLSPREGVLGVISRSGKTS